MPSIIVNKTDLQELLWEENVEGFQIISDEIYDHRRWVVAHRLVFKKDDKLYQTFYDVGATEQQDERPFEYEPDEIKCEEVKVIQIPGYEVIKD